MVPFHFPISLKPLAEQLRGQCKTSDGAEGQHNAKYAKGKEVLFVPDCVGHEDREGTYGTEEGAVEVEAGPVFC